MAITYVDLTGNIADLVGTDFDYRRTKVWIETNIEGDVIIDPTNNQIRLGDAKADVDTAGDFTFTGLVATNSTTNPTAFQYRVWIDYATRRPAGPRAQWDSGWFSLTATSDLADVTAEQYAPPTWQSTFMTDAQALLDAQIAISGIDDTDSAVAGLIEDPLVGPLTNAALSASIGEIAPPAINVKNPAYGATGDGTTNDTAAIQAAIDDAQTIGGTLYFPAGTYIVTGLTSTSGIRWVGEGYRKTIIQSATGDVLTLSGNFHAFEGIHFRGRPGGGHAVVVPPGGVLSQSQFSMCQFTSQNDAKSAFLYTSVGSTGGGIFDVHWIDCYFLHLSTSTVPAFDVYGDTNVFSANKFTRCRAQLCGTAPFFSIEADSSSEYNYNNAWDTINFESCNGGGIRAMSAMDFTIENPGFFDMGTIVGDLIQFGRLAGSPARLQSRGLVIVNYHRSGGTLSGAKDVNLVSGGNAGTTTILGIGGPNSAGILVDLGVGVGYATVIGYDPTNVGIQNPTSSATLITDQLGIQTGKITLRGATGAVVPIIIPGTGTPEGAQTAPVGSIFLRADGATGITLYVKETGTGNTGWVPMRGVITATTAALAAIANAVNTSGKVAGKMVFNTTANKPVWATGSAAGDTWVDATGTVAHTPV